MCKQALNSQCLDEFFNISSIWVLLIPINLLPLPHYQSHNFSRTKICKKKKKFTIETQYDNAKNRKYNLFQFSKIFTIQ